MHIPDGVLSPQVCAATGLASGLAVAYSLSRLRREPDPLIVPKTAMTAALIFAGQMVNFAVPISLLGIPAVSGHLLGGVLAAVLLGPHAGCIALFLVLLLQCFLFADGGLLAIGANTLNMAVVGCWGGGLVYRSVRKRIERPRVGCVVGAVLAAWLSVLAAAGLFCIELGLSWGDQAFDLGRVFTLMVVVHCVIGVGEALITGGVISFVLRQKPELVLDAVQSEGQDAVPQRIGRSLVGIGLATLVVAAFLAPLASSRPDGLEAVSEATAVPMQDTTSRYSLLEEYAVPAPVLSWSQTPAWQRITVAIAGILGSLAVAAAAWLLGRGVRSGVATGHSTAARQQV